MPGTVGSEGCSFGVLSKSCQPGTVSSPGCTEVDPAPGCVSESPFFGLGGMMGCIVNNQQQCVAATCFAGGSALCPGCKNL